LGYALYENLIQKEGRILNPSFIEYKVPTALEIPEMENIVVEAIDPGAFIKAKEAGEGIVPPIAPAIVNAISNALGVRIKELPVTPEMILEGIHSNKR